MQPLLHGKSNEYYVFEVSVCRLMYPACNVHVPYCHLLPARLYNIFLHCLLNGTILGEKVIEHNIQVCVLIFSTTLV